MGTGSEEAAWGPGGQALLWGLGPVRHSDLASALDGLDGEAGAERGPHTPSSGVPVGPAKAQVQATHRSPASTNHPPRACSLTLTPDPQFPRVLNPITQSGP